MVKDSSLPPICAIRVAEPVTAEAGDEMSFQKAADLLRLAEMATSRFGGISLTEIEEAFSIDRRTAQRMTKVLEDMFRTARRAQTTSGGSTGNLVRRTDG